jgi:hypothetical protein
MKPSLPLLVALIAGLLTRSAHAQQTTPAPDASAVVDELDPVQVTLPGPALWKVTRGDSQVVILGFIRPLPHMLNWEKGRLVHALDGAHALLIPPEPRLGMFDMAGLMINPGAFQNARGRKLAEVLPPPDYTAFHQLGATARSNTAKMERYKPVVAGGYLISDYRRAAGLSSEKPVTTVVKLAKAMHVPVREAGRMKASPLLKILGSMSDSASLSCYRAEARQLQWEISSSRAASEAWAHGDMKALRRLSIKDDGLACLEDVPSAQALIDRGVAEGVAVMDDALSRPGKTVALVDMRYLDRAGGILDRLKARGAVISVPN